MTSYSTQRIERDVELQRAEIERTLDALRAKFSAGQIIDSISRSLGSAGGHGNDVLENFGKQVKQNPIPVALIGAGIAWMVVNRSDERHEQPALRHGANTVRPVPFDYEAYVKDEDDHGIPYAVAKLRRGEYDLHRDEPTSSTGFDQERFAADEKQYGMEYALDRLGSGFYSAPADSEGVSFYDRARFNADKAKHGMAYAGEQLKAGAYRARDEAANASRAVYDKARVAADEVSHGAQFVSKQLRAGAYSVSEAAQSVYEDARDVVSDAAASTRQAGRKAQQATADFISEQPLVAGLLGLAVGAAVGSLLPSTRKEDELIGPHRDAVRDELLGAASEASEKVERIADSALEAAKEQAAEEKAAAEAQEKKRSADSRASGSAKTGQTAAGKQTAAKEKAG